jgi:hypothetical protein
MQQPTHIIVDGEFISAPYDNFGDKAMESIEKKTQLMK